MAFDSRLQAERELSPLAPLCKGELLLQCKALTTIEGLLTKVMAKPKQFVASDPSVLAADKVRVIWILQVPLSIMKFDTGEPCRKPAPFGTGAK